MAQAASVGVFPYGAPAEATARFCPWCYRNGDGATCSVQAHWPQVRAHNPLYLSGVEFSAGQAPQQSVEQNLHVVRRRAYVALPVRNVGRGARRCAVGMTVAALKRTCGA